MDPQAENGQGGQHDQPGEGSATGGAPPSSHSEPAAATGAPSPASVELPETAGATVARPGGAPGEALAVAPDESPGEAPARSFAAAFDPADEEAGESGAPDESAGLTVFDPGDADSADRPADEAFDDELVPLEIDPAGRETREIRERRDSSPPAVDAPEPPAGPGVDGGAVNGGAADDDGSYQLHAFEADASQVRPAPQSGSANVPPSSVAPGPALFTADDLAGPTGAPTNLPELAIPAVTAEPADADEPAASAPARKRRPRRRTPEPELRGGATAESDAEPDTGAESDAEDESGGPETLLDYESSAARSAGGFGDEDEAAPARGAALTIPLLCAGLGLLACCLIIPLCDVNRRAAYERLRLRQDLESLQRQAAINDEFLHKVANDPSLAERLAQRQMRKIRAGTRVLPLHDYGGYADAENADAFGTRAGFGASMSPFQIVAVPPPRPLPPYRPLGGRLATLCYNPHSRLYLMGCGLMLLAAGLVLEYSPRSGKSEIRNPKSQTSTKHEEEMAETEDE